MIAELALAAHIFLGSSLLGGHIDVIDIDQGRRICYEYVDGSFVPFYSDTWFKVIGSSEVWFTWHEGEAMSFLITYDKHDGEITKYHTENQWFDRVWEWKF